MSSNIRIQRICQQCGKEYEAKTTVTKTCSTRCAGLLYKARKRAEKIQQSNEETAKVIARPIEEIKAKEFLTIDELTTLLPISRRTVHRLIAKGELKAAKLGRRTIIRRLDIDNLFNTES